MAATFPSQSGAAPSAEHGDQRPAVAVAVRRLAVRELCGRPTGPRGRGGPDPISTPPPPPPPPRAPGGRRQARAPAVAVVLRPVATSHHTSDAAGRRRAWMPRGAGGGSRSDSRPAPQLQSTAAFILVPRRGKSLQTEFPTSQAGVAQPPSLLSRRHLWIFDRRMFRQQSPLVPRQHSSVLTSLLYCAVMVYIV
ncbi:hypothetical protein PVAP13_5KG344907 [Panicum virgatum]|uniref:Uncharacterized protein n=1 Tax=Panicum virgatum TaxID=38727 RepID=A0A8T0SMZ0_PANVG|nr:hypothetical protein PVAP13_5KG344907 [Panicum virgatum]